MRALQLIDDRRLTGRPPEPPPPGRGEVTLRIKAVALNHIDVWGWRGMAFAKRKLPLVVGAEASGEIDAVGAGVPSLVPGQLVVDLSARATCGLCRACREGRDNLCEHVSRRPWLPPRRLCPGKDQPARPPARPCPARRRASSPRPSRR